MFAPRHGTLKEGRSLPGLPYAGPARRGGLRSRQSTLILVGLVFFLLIWFLFYRDPAGSVPARHHVAPVSQMPPSSPSDPEVVLQTSQNDGPVQPASNEAETGPSGQISPDDQRVSKAPFQAPPEETTQRETKLVPGEQQQDKAPLEDEPAAGQPESYSPTAPIPQRPRVQSETFSERPQFEKALARVINLLPGEMEGRDLLRQVEGTGKEKLREMGLRVREYKKFFQAWEDLHLTDDPDGGTYVRDDVIQYLRQHHHHGALNPIPELGDTSIAQIIRSYEAYRYFLVKFGQLLFPWTAPYFPDHMTLHSHFKRGGRGIVLTAGDDQAHFLLTTIATFRNLGCTLPIEVMYLGDSDLSEDYRSDLEALDGVVTRDIAQMVNDEGWKLAGWAAKPFAILFSSFREAIFIDADSLFFTNPEVLFDDPSYQRTGALFFRDRLIMPESKKRWLQQILPKPISRQVKQSRFWTGDSGHMQESGVVVVDKWKHFIALLMVTRMNGPDRDGNKEEGRIGVYDMVYGDKETFWIGWELVGDMDYAFHQGDAGIMGAIRTPKQEQEPKQDEKKPEEKARRKKKLKKDGGQDGGPDGEQPEHIEGEPDQGQGEEETGEDREDEEEPTETTLANEGSSLPSTPDNYTICAPQLLHLDLDGKPLWFNGWLLESKFADKKQKKFGDFQSYLIEPREVRNPGAWQLEEGNVCCLTSDAHLKREFDEDERKILNMMIQRAKEVGVDG